MAKPYTQILKPIAHAVAKTSRDALLDALLERVGDDDLIEHAKFVRYRVPDTMDPANMVLAESSRLLQRASEFMRRAKPAEKQLVGCSFELLAVAAQEALELEQKLIRHHAVARAENMLTRSVAKKRAEMEDERERAIVESRRASTQAARVCEHARQLLERLRSPADADEAPPSAPPAPHSVVQVAATIRALARSAREVLHDGDRGEKARALLYGITEDTVTNWEDVAAEAERAADVVFSQQEAEPSEPPRSEQPVTSHELYRATGVILVLMTYIIEAFEAGHRLDKRVPRIYSLLALPTRCRSAL